MEQRRAWPLALFASRWDRVHYKESLEMHQYIPGMTRISAESLPDTPDQQVIDNFEAYNKWFEAQQPKG